MSDILATKYRPKKLSDMIGQDHAVKILTNTILYGNLHHSYIFAGFLEAVRHLRQESLLHLSIPRLAQL